MLFDLRITPDCDYAKIKTELIDSLQEISDELNLAIDLREMMPPVPPFEQERQSELVSLAEKLTGHNASSVNFATEAPFIKSLGMDTVILGPGSIERAHQPNEYRRNLKMCIRHISFPTKIQHFTGNRFEK